MDMTTIITNAIKPELLVLIPVLYLIGTAVKKTEKINNKYIPIILGAVGIAVALLYVLATAPSLTGFQPILLIIFSAFVQGVLCAGCSVYCNQLFKQLTDKKQSTTTQYTFYEQPVINDELPVPADSDDIKNPPETSADPGTFSAPKNKIGF